MYSLPKSPRPTNRPDIRKITHQDKPVRRWEDHEGTKEANLQEHGQASIVILTGTFRTITWESVSRCGICWLPARNIISLQLVQYYGFPWAFTHIPKGTRVIGLLLASVNYPQGRIRGCWWACTGKHRRVQHGNVHSAYNVHGKRDAKSRLFARDPFPVKPSIFYKTLSIWIAIFREPCTCTPTDRSVLQHSSRLHQRWIVARWKLKNSCW